MSVMNIIEDLQSRLKAMENAFSNYESRKNNEEKYKKHQQVQTLNAPIIAYCISTIDPRKLNRIRFFSPFLHETETKIEDLPFARCVSPMGGHDDCGVSWVPPAGSTVVIVHENGDRNSPLYLGTVYHADRGPDGNLFPYPILEYQKLFCDRGEGYLAGDTDGSQAYPPWNTESYNGYDVESDQQFENDPDAQKKITYPNVYGFKTPGKHWYKAVDGDYRCQNRWKRLEIGSACGGGWMLFKDDWLHPGGQWANPSCGGPTGSLDDDCLDVSELLGEQVEGVQDADGNFIGAQIGDCINNSKGDFFRDSPPDIPQAANPYFKRSEECRPYKGAPTPQANKCALPQSGIQFLSRSGHTKVFDDSVEQPQGKKVRWQEDFNFGYTDLFKGKMFEKSATGHLIELNDSEDVSRLRGINNGARIKTAAGHEFKMIDHTLEGNIAGAFRQISLTSTSNHALIMSDETNEQASPERKEGGVPRSKSRNAWVMLRSGYGLVMRFDDTGSQEETQNQSITIMAPRRDQPNTGVAPGSQSAELGAPTEPSCIQGHMFRMQLGEDGGFVLSSSGGHYVCSSVKNHITEVGREDCDGHKVNMVFGHYVTQCKKTHITKSEREIHIADKYIILGAGLDCEIKEDDDDSVLEQALSDVNQSIESAPADGSSVGETPKKGPCFFPVIVAKCPRICPFTGFVHWTEKSMSDRVIASSTGCSDDEEEEESSLQSNGSQESSLRSNQ